MLLVCGTCHTASADQFGIVGRVTDGDGNSLTGVSVVTNLLGVGTLTDADGTFVLPLSDSVVRITFTSVGYRARQLALENLPDVIVLEREYFRGQNILVTADRAEYGITPIAFDNLTSNQIERDYSIAEFPLLLNSTPNAYAFSDGGAPLGYSYLRIRGFDDKRVSTYINGVPLNDPEDQATYFVDLPDFGANISDIQVQRGVGNSLYGDASFGGSINVVTNLISRPRQAVITSGYGQLTSDGSAISDIYKQSLEYSSGLIGNRWSYAGRFSKQKTGGYRHNSWYEGWAYSFSLARLDRDMTTELHVYGGPIRMHLAFYGASRDDIARDRRTNPLRYDNETDNFNQPHYQLHNTWRLNDRTTLSNTLYYIRGKGYYEQFKSGRDFFEYNISPTITGIDTSTGQPFRSGDLVRQQWVEKSQYGWNPRLDIDHKRGKHSVGGSFYYFASDHWGQVVWAQHIDGLLNPRNRYYQYDGKKWVGSLYAQEQLELTETISAQLTAQLRYQRYRFDQDIMGAFKGFDYDIDWLFFSPRMGINYRLSERTNLYSHFAISSRTPTDASIYDANDPFTLPSLDIESISLGSANDTIAYRFGDPTAASERVYNLELGGQYRSSQASFGFNLFWMDFRDEIVPEGHINENTGLLITTNADRSVHSGIELSGAWKPTDRFTFDANFALNHNRFRSFRGEIDVYTDTSSYRTTADYADNTIPGFPEYIGNFIADYKSDRFRLTYSLRLLGKQFVELFNVDSLAIDPFSLSSLAASYTLPPFNGVGDLTLLFRIDNLFDKKYESSGYGWTFGLADAPGGPVSLSHGGEYYVGAERSFYAQLRLALY